MGTSKKCVGVDFGVVCHTIKHTSVKHTLRCLHIMHLVRCVGQSVCATSHLLYVQPRHVAAGYATPAVRPQKGNRNAFACHAVQRDVWRTKKPTHDRGFLELSVKPLRERKAASLVN